MFVKFQGDVHNINLLPTKDPLRQIHQAIFIVTNDDVDAIVNLWPEEWRDPLAEPLPEEQNVEEPPIHQVNDEDHEGNDAQEDPSQENMEDDDDMEDSDQHPLEQPLGGDQTQNCVQPEEGHSSRKKQKADKMENTTILTEDELQELSNVVKKVAQDNLHDMMAQKASIANQVQDHLNKLKTVVSDVKDTMEAETYGIDPNIPLVTPTLVPPIKVLI